MQPDERDIGFLWDMFTNAKYVRDFVKNVTYEQFIQDKKLQWALERALEIIGEAARRISDEFKQAHPEIPWKDIIGQRNVLAHQYDKIEQEHVFNLATNDINDLISMLEPLIPPLPPEIED